MPSVGKNIPHDSARGHVSGESIYIDDMPPARDEVIVDFYWSPVAHGRIRSIDVEAARTIEGVIGLWTHKDLAKNVFGPILHDEIMLAADRVMFIGHPIVVIAAESAAAAKLAKAAIKVDIETLDPVLSIEEAKKRREFMGDIRFIRRGDVDKAFASAEHILEGTWVNGGQDHFYLESQAALAVPGEFDQLTVHSSTQNPSEVQHVIAELLGLPLNKVTIVTKRMGGGFGGKECQATHPAVIAAIAALKTKRPARLIYGKDDDMRITGGRHPFRNDWKVAFTSDGVITALKVDLYSDGGAFADLSPAVMGRAMTHVDNAYFLANADITGTICRTNFPPNTAFRGFGGPQGVATIENIVEEIAISLGIDPIEVRARNLYGIGDRNTTPYGQVVEHNTLPRLITQIRETSDYDARAAVVKAFNESSPTHLRGIACTMVKFGISFNTKFLNQANALVNVYLDGTVQVSTGATEMGQGVNTKIQQIVADELGIDASFVIVMSTSTEKNNNTSATAASSGADLNGGAAADACRQIRARLTDVAASELARLGGDKNPAPDHVVFAEGQVFDDRRPELPMRWRDLIMSAYMQRVSLGERGFYATPRIDWSWDSGDRHPFLYFTNGCAVSEVEIDRFTGHMRVLRSDLLMDIGKPINPGIDRGQITGAFVQGMGWLTNEELRYTPAGDLLSHSPTTYKIPNITDLPPVFHVDWIENDTNRINIRSSKAVGEPPLLLGISVFMAIKNALTHAAGGANVPLESPATGEQILMRLTEIRHRRAQPEPERTMALSAPSSV